MKFPDYIPAKRAETPDMVRAAMLQHQADMQAKEYNDQRKRDRNALPAELYGTYSEVTGTNPIADAIKRAKDKGLGTGGQTATAGSTPVSAPPPGVSTPPPPAVNPTPTGVDPLAMQGLSAGEAASKMSTMAPTSTAVTPAAQTGAKLGGDVMGKAGANVAGNAGAAAVPVVGGLVNAGVTAAQGGSTAQVAKSGVGGAATGALAAYGAPLAAAGPVGWAGIAALAAASLYGMLG